MSKRIVQHNGIEYNACQEGLARDGCLPPREWYWVVNDPKMGACIDSRVPEEHFKTLRAARAALARQLGIEL